MTILTVVTDPLLERTEDTVPKILEAFSEKQIKGFANASGAANTNESFFEWLKEFIDNSLYVVILNNHNKIEGFITAKNSQELSCGQETEKEPLVLTGFYSHPRDRGQELGMMEVLVEAAVLLGYKQLKIPNATELMREFTDQMMVKAAFKDIEVLRCKDSGFDLFDLSGFKTYAMLEAEKQTA